MAAASAEQTANRMEGAASDMAGNDTTVAVADDPHYPLA